MEQTKERFDYLLGVNQAEPERLCFQHAVWAPVMRG